jgi:hypothetical protein
VSAILKHIPWPGRYQVSQRLPTPLTNGDGNRRNQRGQRHPILDIDAENVEALDKNVQGRFPGWKLGPANRKNISFFIFLRCSSSLNFQLKATRLLALDAPKCAVCVLLLCQAILDYINHELATPIHKHGDTFNRLTPRPQAEFVQAVARQILPSDPGR